MGSFSYPWDDVEGMRRREAEREEMERKLRLAMLCGPIGRLPDEPMKPMRQ